MHLSILTIPLSLHFNHPTFSLRIASSLLSPFSLIVDPKNQPTYTRHILCINFDSTHISSYNAARITSHIFGFCSDNSKSFRFQRFLPLFYFGCYVFLHMSSKHMHHGISFCTSLVSSSTTIET